MRGCCLSKDWLKSLCFDINLSSTLNPSKARAKILGYRFPTRMQSAVPSPVPFIPLPSLSHLASTPYRYLTRYNRSGM